MKFVCFRSFVDTKWTWNLCLNKRLLFVVYDLHITQKSDNWELTRVDEDNGDNNGWDFCHQWWFWICHHSFYLLDFSSIKPLSAKLGGHGHELNGRRCPYPRHGMDTEFFEIRCVDMDMDTAWNRCPPNSDCQLSFCL